MDVPLLVGEDAARLYLYKPAGIPVFPPHADPDGDCVLARLVALDPARATGWPDAFAGGIAHRLDTATSGLLLVARTPSDLEVLRGQFRDGVLRKRYRFRASVPAPFARLVVEVPLAHDPRKKDRMVWQRGPRTAHRGRWYPAWTELTALGGADYRAVIRTGVMHQVRVHAQSAGVALDGDRLYAPPERRGLPFLLHHEAVEAPGWASPVVPPPQGGGLPQPAVG